MESDGRHIGHGRWRRVRTMVGTGRRRECRDIAGQRLLHGSTHRVSDGRNEVRALGIERRFHAMLASGFLDEVARLRARGDLGPELPSMRCVGYRQAWSHLEGEIPHAEMLRQALAASRQLAKRQLTWLRSLPGIEPAQALEAALSRG